MSKYYHTEEGYDVVIVGDCITGSVLASQLSKQKKKVLLLEAGTDENIEDHQSYIEI